ncbi:glycosyltransferase [Lacticaseibacillus absianus]|uniref:glycosyltransferase n=1 Tax=Lacticaseibacillus absianus TaxID=2729623 RepID=UPI0015CD229B|nr:glycosyltransferase [Lacticaseibacillus absianus]
MIYSILENVFTFNSGTEHGAIRRTLALTQTGTPAKLLLRNYNRFLARDAAAVSLKAADVVNMYDFFQGTQDVEREEVELRLLPQLPLETYHIVSIDANVSRLLRHGNEIGRITVMPGTVGLVNEIIYTDRYGNRTVRENYDWRGFKSSIDYFHPDGQLARQYFLNREGEIVLEITHMFIGDQVRPTMWKLHHYRGRDYRFNTEDQLFLFFLNEYLKGQSEVTLISDRRNLDHVVAAVTGAEAKYAYFHDTHLDLGRNRVLSAYQPVLKELAAKFDGILVGTAGQRRALRNQYPQLNVAVMADSFVPLANRAVQETPLAVRDHRIVMVGRIAADRRPADAVRAMEKVLAQVPDAHLDFYGYAESPEMRERIEQLIAKHGLTDAVTINDYQSVTELAAQYANARVLLSPAAHEGLGMTLLDAMGTGTPVVAYDAPYGPQELIRPGENGYLVRSGQVAALAERLVKLLTNDQLWQQFHDEAIATAAAYTEDAMAASVKEVVARPVHQ